MNKLVLGLAALLVVGMMNAGFESVGKVEQASDARAMQVKQALGE